MTARLGRSALDWSALGRSALTPHWVVPGVCPGCPGGVWTALGPGAGVRVSSPDGAVAGGTSGSDDGAGADCPDEEISTSGSRPAGGVVLGFRLPRGEGEAEGTLLGRPRPEVARRAAAVECGVPLARGTRLCSDLCPELGDAVGEPVGERSTTCCPRVPTQPIGGSSGPVSAPLTRVSVSARTTIAPPTAAAVKILARRPLWSTKTAVRAG